MSDMFNTTPTPPRSPDPIPAQIAAAPKKLPSYLPHLITLAHKCLNSQRTCGYTPSRVLLVDDYLDLRNRIMNFVARSEIEKLNCGSEVGKRVLEVRMLMGLIEIVLHVGREDGVGRIILSSYCANP
jgi:hypothetical protein